MDPSPANVLPDARARAERPHLLALDGVRGIAIVLVLLFHQSIGEPRNRLDRVVHNLIGAGWTGVTLFFVLSGFLITGILLDSRGARHYFRNFYARRALRIFPLYYAVLFLSLVVLVRIVLPHMDLESGKSALAGVAGQEWWYWLYLVNFRLAFQGQGGSYLDIAWSLSMEEQFYLVWPLVVWLVRPRWLGAVCGVLIVGAVTMRVGMLVADYPAGAVKMLTTSFLDALGAGALLAVVARSPRAMARCAEAAPWVFVAAVAVFLGCWFRLPNEFDQFYPRITMPMAVVASASLVMLAYHKGRVARLLAWAPLRFFGRYSYAMYLLHLPILILSRGLFDPNDYVVLHSVLPAQFVFYGICTTWVTLCAIVSWYVLEQPCLSLKRYFRDSPRGERS
jgi:peptidoglycan/LPS O-acetylase OafA/YrhL